MAVDSRRKRMSALNFGRHSALVLPAVGGGIDQGDRQQLLGLYSGILVGDTLLDDICISFDAISASPSMFAVVVSSTSIEALLTETDTSIVASLIKSETSLSGIAKSRTSISGGVKSGC